MGNGRTGYSSVLNPQLLIEFICPTKNEIIYQEEETDYFCELNESQRKAVNTVINSDYPLSLIQGPPGTGKTQVISEICLQLCRKKPNIRILVCSETHVAVNNLITRIMRYDPSIRCLRIRDKEQNPENDVSSPKAIMTAYQNWIAEVCDNEEIVNIIKESIQVFGG